MLGQGNPLGRRVAVPVVGQDRYLRPPTRFPDDLVGELLDALEASELPGRSGTRADPRGADEIRQHLARSVAVEDALGVVDFLAEDRPWGYVTDCIPESGGAILEHLVVGLVLAREVVGRSALDAVSGAVEVDRLEAAAFPKVQRVDEAEVGHRRVGRDDARGGMEHAEAPGVAVGLHQTVPEAVQDQDEVAAVAEVDGIEVHDFRGAPRVGCIADAANATRGVGEVQEVHLAVPVRVVGAECVGRDGGVGHR